MEFLIYFFCVIYFGFYFVFLKQEIERKKDDYKTKQI